MAVVFYHAILHWPGYYPAVFQAPIQNLPTAELVAAKFFVFLFNGHSAVTLFFVLSGFVLKLSFDRMQGPILTGTLVFVIRRLFRLYPALIVCMLAFGGLALLYRSMGWTGMPAPDVWAVLKNASLWQMTWHNPSATVQGELLAVPFLVAMFLMSRVFGASALVFCAILWITSIEAPQFVGNLPNMNTWMFYFALGAVAADRNLGSFFKSISGPGIGLLIVTFFVLRAVVNFASLSSIVANGLLSAVLIGAIYHQPAGSSVAKFLTTRPIRLLGEISYSLYLLNVLALWVVWEFARQWSLYEQAPLLTGLGVGVVATLITIPFAYLSKVYVEDAGVRLGKWVTRGKRPAMSDPAVHAAP